MLQNFHVCSVVQASPDSTSLGLWEEASKKAVSVLRSGFLIESNWVWSVAEDQLPGSWSSTFFRVHFKSGCLRVRHTGPMIGESGVS